MSPSSRSGWCEAIRCLAACSLLALLLGCSSAATSSQSTHTWIQSGYEDFHKGHFDDGGANAYVSAAGTVEQIHKWDLISDGFIDLVFANTHAQSEKLDAALYWGNGKDFDVTRMSAIPNDGSQYCTAADLDGDGRVDLIFPSSTNGTWSKQDSRIYYNGPQQQGDSSDPSTAFHVPPFNRKTLLPTEAAQRAAVADLNKDGYPDIIFAQSAGYWEYRGGTALASPSRIFWGGKNGFARDRYTNIDASGASDVAVADLNNDGWPDIVLANRERNGKFDINSYIYWGGKEGFAASRRTELPTNQANAVAVADLDKDGFADIVFANGAGTASFVYLNDHSAFDAHRRIELPTSDARGCAVGDLNGDGWPDLFITNFQTAGNHQTKSYLYWGSASGFSAGVRQEFETVGACGVSIGDLNEDGLPDVVVSNFAWGTTMDVPSYIYWNSKKGLSDRMRTSVFTHGAVGNTIADINGDGHLDVIFNNTMAGTRGGVSPLYVYWGNRTGNYTPEHRQELPSVETYGWACADLNQDGWPDLIVANQAETGRRITESFIYWGGPSGFSAERCSAIMGSGAKSANVADLDGDGYLDLMLVNAAPDSSLFIYSGSRDGFITTARTELPAGGVGYPEVADLNGDGHLDVVVAGGPRASATVYWGDGTRRFSTERKFEIPDSKAVSNIEIADMNRDGALDLILTRRGQEPPASYIYYGNGKGEYSTDRRCEFRPVECQGVTVADVNRDGWLDVICPCYSAHGSRSTESRIYFGGPKGLSENSIQELPTFGGTGSMLADFNHDGYPDLLLICHRFEGNADEVGATSDHVTDSFLYWGGADGFKPDRKLRIPGRGAHYDSGIDLGNIFDRRPAFNYVSTAHEYGNRFGDRIEWTAKAEHGRTIKFQVRTASSESGLEQAKWCGPGGEGTYFDRSGSSLKTPSGHSWIQYRATFESRDGADSASLTRVELSFK